ncbi:MAG: heme-binding protein [Celeribacter sp.]|jgi:uncharacterized protein GlcG (DUF336 family)
MIVKPTPQQIISYETACRIVSAALEAASRADKDVSVAVVDPAGHLVAFGRSDTAAILSVNVAIDKAYTAAISRIPTHQWQDTVATDAPIRNGVPGAIPRLIAVGGGQLIWHEGQIIGAIGVSGAHWDGDRALGEEALRSLGLFEVATRDGV